MELFTAQSTPRHHDEDDIQRAIVQALRWGLPHDALACHIPNGGKRHKREAARLVGLGVRAGMPDLLIVHQGRARFVEVKAPGGQLSMEQHQMIRKLADCGCSTGICRSVDDVIAELADARIPLRLR